MYTVYFDSGTTNSRGYVLKGEELICRGTAAFGAKDVSVSDGRQSLLQRLKKLYDDLLAECGLADRDIGKIYASGMVSSPFGIKEVDHERLPVSSKELYHAVTVLPESDYFKRNIHIIPGIKTRAGAMSLEQLEALNNTRGEEIEALGLIPIFSDKFKEDYVILFPGSHTHALLIGGDYIVDAHSSMGGELLSALAEHTVLASEVHAPRHPQTQWIQEGCRLFKIHGFARAVYIVHAGSIFKAGTKEQRFDLLTGIVTSSVIDSLKVKTRGPWADVNKIVVAGSPLLSSAYCAAVKALMPKQNTYLIPQSINPSVEGLKQLIKEDCYA